MTDEPIPRTDWQGAWVWHEAAEAERNAYAFFRRTFALPAEVTYAIHITADSFYSLHVDGDGALRRFIARGPARSPLAHYSFDSHVVRLAPGRHAVAVLVHHVGEINAAMMRGRTGGGGA